MSPTASPHGAQRSDPVATPATCSSPSAPWATPTVDGDRLYILSQTGDFVCFTTDGKEVWRVSYVKDLGGIMPVWGFAESPLVDGDKIICTPGAEDATMMALDKATAKPIWKCKVPEGPDGQPRFPGNVGGGLLIGHRGGLRGRAPVRAAYATTLVGVAASDGKLLWRYDRASNTHRINCTTPLYHDGMVIAASAYDAGGGGEVEQGRGRAITAKEVFFSPRMKNHHGGMIVVGDCLYGAAGGNEGGYLVCLDLSTGKQLWMEREAPKGSLTLADGRLYLRTEKGTVLLIEPNRERFIERGRFEQPDRTREPAWLTR